MEEIKQYCRYCAHLVTGNGTYCTMLEKEKSDSAAKRVNKCKFFAFNPIDAFFENARGYRPRKPKQTQCDGQMRIEGV